MIKTLIAAGSASVFFCAPAMAQSNPDSLPVTRMATMSFAYDFGGTNLATDSHRLTPVRLEMMQAAYNSHDPAPSADRFEAQHWHMIQNVYRAYDAGLTRDALLSN